MNDVDRNVRLENFVAELTSAVYPLVLRRGPKEPWIQVELALWRAVAETVRRWARQRPAAASADEVEAWRGGLLVDLTESAISVAVGSGLQGPLLEVELALYRACRLAVRRFGRGRESA